MKNVENTEKQMLKKIKKERESWKRAPIYKKSGLPLLVFNLIYRCPADAFQFLSVDWLARQLGVSSSHVSKEVKRVFDSTPQEFITRRKISLAKELLLNRIDLSIEEVAQKLDYCNGNYFIKVFKKQCRITPLQYRLQYREERKKKHNLKRLAVKIEKAINQAIFEATNGQIEQAVYVHGGLQDKDEKKRSDFFF